MLLLAITILACATRLLHLGRMALWWDECHTVRIAVAAGRAAWATVAEAVLGGLSTYILLLSPWAARETPEWALRLPSAAAGIALVVVLARLGREIGQRHLAWTLGALAALSPFLVWHAREARWYALTWLLIGIGALYYVKLLRRWHWGWAAGCLGAGLLAASTHAPAVTIPAAQMAWLLVLTLRRRRARGVAMPHTPPRWTTRLAILPLLALLLVGGFWAWTTLVEPVLDEGVEGYRFQNVGELHPARIAYTGVAFATGYSLGPGPLEWHSMKRADLNVAEGSLLLLGVAAFFGLLLAGVSTLYRSQGMAIAGGLLVPAIAGPLLVIAASLWTGHTYAPRYSGIGYPFALCLVAAGLGHPTFRRTVVILGALLVALQLLSVSNLLTDPRYERENIRDAAAHIAPRATGDDLILLFGGADLPWEHYYRGEAPWRIVYPTDPSKWTDAELHEQAEGARVVWTVRARLWDVRGAGAMAARLDERYPVEERIEFIGGVVVTRHGGRIHPPAPSD